MLDGWDGEEPRLREPRSHATVRQLVTHTSGLGYWFWNADLVRWEARTGTGNALAGTRDAFTAPDTTVVKSFEVTPGSSTLTVRFPLGRLDKPFYLRLRGTDGNRTQPGLTGAGVDPTG